MVMAYPLGCDLSSQVQGYATVKKVGVPDFPHASLVNFGAPSLSTDLQ